MSEFGQSQPPGETHDLPEPPLRDEPLSWPVVESTYLHKDDWVVAFRSDMIHRPQHPEDVFRRLVVDDPGAVVVLAIDEQDRVVVVHQYRHPVQMRLVELPAGKLDQVGEDPVVAAQRELREEVGLHAREWTHLMTTYASPGITSETHALYLARGLEEVDRDFHLHHEEAEMAVSWVPLDTLLEAVLDGSVADAPLATAVLAYEALRTRGRLD